MINTYVLDIDLEYENNLGFPYSLSLSYDHAQPQITTHSHPSINLSAHSTYTSAIKHLSDPVLEKRRRKAN